MQSQDIKSVGIIGAGRIGKTIAQIAGRAGLPVVISNSRGPASLVAVVEELGGGVTAGTVGEAAAADVVVIAVMWPDVAGAVDGLDWSGRIVIDPTNDFEPGDLNGRTSSEVVSELVAPARVVKIANTVGAGVLALDPREADGQRVLFLSGDDADAKSVVQGLFADAGFYVVDLGSLHDGGQMQQFGGPLAGLNLIRLA